MRLEPHSLAIGSRLTLAWIRQVWEGLRRRTVIAGRGLRATYTPNGTILEAVASKGGAASAETPDDGISINIREADAETGVPRARQLKDFAIPPDSDLILTELLSVNLTSGRLEATASSNGVRFVARVDSDDGVRLVYLPIKTGDTGDADLNTGLGPCDNHPGGTESVPVNGAPVGVPAYGSAASSGGVPAVDPDSVPACNQ